MIDKIPPHNLEAEMALLGAVMVDRDLYDVVAQYVKPSSFYAHVHETIFATFQELVNENQPLDKITIAERLRSKDALERVGGVSYLSTLMDTVQTASSAMYYARIVAEKAGLRQLIAIGTNAVQLGYEAEEEGPIEAANQIIALLEGTIQLSEPNKPLTGGALSEQIATDFDSPQIRLYPTPWEGVNRKIKGFGVPSANVIAGNPGQGKTGFAMNLADYYARQYGRDVGAVAYVPLEMGRTDTLYRWIATWTGISATRIKERKHLTDSEIRRIRKAIEQFKTLPIVVPDNYPLIDFPTLRLMLRKIKRERGLHSVFLDHLGLFKEVVEEENQHRAQRRILEGILPLANELGCPIFLLQHIARIARDKEGHIPMPTMYDLRGGGNPEGIAHNILILWRPDPDDPDKSREAFVKIEKARGGRTGMVPLEFHEERTLFLNSREEYPEQLLWFPEPRDDYDGDQQPLPEPPRREYRSPLAAEPEEDEYTGWAELETEKHEPPPPPEEDDEDPFRL